MSSRESAVVMSGSWYLGGRNLHRTVCVSGVVRRPFVLSLSKDEHSDSCSAVVLSVRRESALRYRALRYAVAGGARQHPTSFVRTKEVGKKNRLYGSNS